MPEENKENQNVETELGWFRKFVKNHKGKIIAIGVGIVAPVVNWIAGDPVNISGILQSIIGS